MRKLTAARMIAIRTQSYEPTALIDADRMQRLILEARRQIQMASNLTHQYPIVSAKELNSHTD